ncbi:hypothetical protein SAMN05444405_10672 [Bacteroides luti]|uniref:Uncharacterized protein n=1 Tax=Bacteroides luti TaxID=1297750 RepID=A0A1M4ZVZ1_9BACE|nr:hypothetical protein SAMN05444405_10672 [Bacteroides luti]
MQCLVDLTEFTDQPVFDPSLFVTICKRLQIDNFKAFTEELLSILIRNFHNINSKNSIQYIKFAKCVLINSRSYYGVSYVQLKACPL